VTRMTLKAMRKSGKIAYYKVLYIPAIV